VWHPLIQVFGNSDSLSKLKNGEWKPVEDRFEVKLSSWIRKLLSYGDRLILINSVLTSLPMFLLSFFEIPVGVCKRLNFLDHNLPA
jgi:hypothetical protein